MEQGLKRLLAAIEASGKAVLPSSNLELLQSIVDAAAQIFGAAAASVSLVDEKNEELVFEVSYGIGREDVVGMRIPLDKGIAGYVAMTGQPIAISDVQRDERFLKDFAKSTGYVPNSILAMPLISNDRVIGVMQVLDKINAPSFGMQDMELLGVFARQAALAISQSQQIDSLTEALVQGLRQLIQDEPDAASEEVLRVLEASAGEGRTRRNELLALATAFYEISAMGEAERQMCIKIMSVLGDYVQSRPDLDIGESFFK